MNQQVLVWIVLFAFLGYMMWNQARQRRRQQEMLDSIVVGERVVTIGGIFGTVVRVDHEKLGLEVAPGVVVEVARAAVSSKVERDVVAPELPEGPDQP